MTDRYVVLVFDPQRRLGDGLITSPTADREKADTKAASIQWAADRMGLDVTTVVLPVASSATGAGRLAALTQVQEAT